MGVIDSNSKAMLTLALVSDILSEDAKLIFYWDGCEIWRTSKLTSSENTHWITDIDCKNVIFLDHVVVLYQYSILHNSTCCLREVKKWNPGATSKKSFKNFHKQALRPKIKRQWHMLYRSIKSNYYLRT